MDIENCYSLFLEGARGDKVRGDKARYFDYFPAD